jgi:antirestriction protein ArdC
MKRFDIYETVTNLIVERLEAGVVPWHMPWKTSGSIPRNLISKKSYRGFNFWYLLSFGFERPYFLTFNQIKQLGASVKKGSKSFMVLFWKMVEYEKDGETEEIPMLRYYRVFHIDDVEGINPDKIPENKSHDHEFDPIASCEQIIEFWCDSPVIRLNKKKACYIPSLDEVHMPNPRTFFKDEEYYSTIFHELCHATGARRRLNRHEKFSNLNFGSNDYSQEELVAEMGAAYLSGICGIENAIIDNSAAYIQGWLKKLKSDKKFIVMASGMAQKAVDYILRNQDSKPKPKQKPVAQKKKKKVFTISMKF